MEKDGITCEIAETVEKDPRGKLHWVSSDAMQCELRDYDHLFTVGKVDDEKWESQLSDTSLVVRDKALVERLERPSDGTAFQFERLGFYAVDPDATTD